ncbi:MAG: nitroreductase family protein [Spirochaetes bacterium]|nr:nitroreductase family protein [Spirochaetota bacterium]
MSANPLSFLSALGRILKGKPQVPKSLAGNPTLSLLMARRSVRKFQKRRIPDDVFAAILEAARVAPCTVNLQTWTFGVYDQSQWKKTFGSPMPFLGDRAVILFADMARSRAAIPNFPYKPLCELTLATVNVGIAAYAMNIAAEALGVSSVMLSETGKTGFYDARYLKEKLGLPHGVLPITTLVLGYSASTPKTMPPKYPLSELAFTGRYKKPDAKAVKRWYDEMSAGYRATYVTHSFKDKLNQYLGKADEAEAGLQALVLGKKEEFRKKI